MTTCFAPPNTKNEKDTYEYKQQTPKPAAQLPSIVPEFSLHSEEVKHVPMSDEVFPVHMLNQSLNTCVYHTGCLSKLYSFWVSFGPFFKIWTILSAFHYV